MNLKFKWNPSEDTLIKMKDKDYYVSFKAFRTSSGGYARKKYVREYIFDKYNNECVKCKSIKELQVDHVKSVNYCFLNNLTKHCNILGNLQLMCSKCNIKKSNK